MSRQVEADEVLGELEITALAADFRANQRLCSAGFLCKVAAARSRSIKLNASWKAAHRTPALRCR